MRTRLVILAILVVVGLAALYFLVQRETTPVDRAAGPVPEAPAPSAPEPAAPPLSAPVVEPAPAPRPVAPESEQELPGRIIGRVYDGAGLPAEAVTITASWVPLEGAPAGTRAPGETVTSDDGAFVLDGLPLGWHLLLAWRDQDTARERCLLLVHAPVTEAVLVLKPRHAIAGVVVGPNRQPVSQATLHPVLNNGETVSQDNAMGLAMRTDNEGGFLFEAPDPGEWEFLVAAAGYAPTLSPPIPTGTEDARIQLLKGVSVSGRVVQDATNAPVPGATVQLAADKLPGPPLVAEADASGGFTLNAVAPGDYLLEVETEGLTLPEAPMRLAVENAPVANLVLRLVTGGVIRGNVFVQESSEPLVGIEVLARRTGRDPVRRLSRPTDAQGRFEFVGLPGGEYVLSTKWLRGFAMVGRSDDSVTVQLQPGQVVDGVVLALRQGLTITGRVLDAEGNPVGGADVRGRGQGWQDQQTSDADGAFILANLTPGMEVTLSAATSTATSGLQGPMTVSETGLRDIELVLSQARDVLMAGVVVDVRDRPLTAKVIAWPDAGQVVDFPPMDSSDTQGRFVLPNVAPGAYRVTVKPGQGEQIEVLRVSVEAGQQLRDLRLVYPQEASFAIAGRVVDPDGEAVTCSLTLFRLEGNGSIFQDMSSTTIDGKFRFECLAPGTYGMEVQESRGFQAALLYDVTAGTEDLEIVLAPALRLSGQVVDASGNPITDFEMALVASGGMPSPSAFRRREFQAVSHPEGRFALEVGEGWYKILVHAEGHETQEFTVGDVSADNPAEELQFVLK